jgi:hypothetical protein
VPFGSTGSGSSTNFTVRPASPPGASSCIRCSASRSLNRATDTLELEATKHRNSLSRRALRTSPSRRRFPVRSV